MLAKFIPAPEPHKSSSAPQGALPDISSLQQETKDLKSQVNSSTKSKGRDKFIFKDRLINAEVINEFLEESGVAEWMHGLADLIKRAVDTGTWMTRLSPLPTRGSSSRQHIRPTPRNMSGTEKLCTGPPPLAQPMVSHHGTKSVPGVDRGPHPLRLPVHRPWMVHRRKRSFTGEANTSSLSATG